MLVKTVYTPWWWRIDIVETRRVWWSENDIGKLYEVNLQVINAEVINFSVNSMLYSFFHVTIINGDSVTIFFFLTKFKASQANEHCWDPE